jgi:hypothetical protein
LNRTPRLFNEIKDILYGVRKLTGIDEFEFKYHKENEAYPVTEETLDRLVPKTPGEYDGLLTKVRTEGIKKFFGKTLMDDLTLDGDVITIHKPFDKQVQLKIVREDDSQTMLESITDVMTLDTESTSEAFWLTKVLGDYDIS